MKTRLMPEQAPAVLLLACAAAGLCGCGLVRTAAEAPGRVASAALNPGAKDEPPPDPSIVQARLMRFADLFAIEIGNSTKAFAELAGTTEARIQALNWKLDYTNLMWRIASGPRPYASLFDAIVAVTALRAGHEERWLAQWGEADRPLITSLSNLEKEVWSLADEPLNDAQMSEVRTIVATWLEGDPESRVTDVARLPGFVDVSRSKASSGGLFGELSNLMTVDPLAGLEPAVREMGQARQLLERAFYYLQRMPELVSARIELQVLRSSQSPEVQGTLASVERASQAAASLAATAAALPATFSAEREAALDQIGRELTAQRTGLVQDLETAREPVTALLEQSRLTAEAARAMSDSLAETLRVLDEFVGGFQKKAEEPEEPVVLASAAGPASAEPAGKPFDIADYGAAAERIGVAARELGTTIATLDKSLPEVQRVLEEAVARGERTVDHAFARALQLLAAVLVGAAVAVLGVRWISGRFRIGAG